MPSVRPETRYYHPWCQHQDYFSSSFSGYYYGFQIQNITVVKPTPQILYTYMYPQKHYFFSSLWVTQFLTCRPPDTDPFLCSILSSDDPPHMKCWMVGSSWYWVLYLLFSGIEVLTSLQYEAIFFNFFSQKSNPKGISVIGVAPIQLQPG